MFIVNNVKLQRVILFILFLTLFNVQLFNAQCVQAPGVLRDDFNRPDGALPGSNKWVLILNQPGSASMAIVNGALQPTNSAGNTNYGGVAWDSLLGPGSEMSFRVVQKSGNFSYASLFLYARMNSKDYNTGTGYRLRYLEQSGTDILQIQKIGPGYPTGSVLATASYEINPGDVITFRVLCDNQTMVGLVNGTQVLSVKDATYSPAQWYSAVRTCVYSTPFRIDDFMVSPQPPGPPPPPAVPSLVSPFNGATGQPMTLALNWNSAVGASTYHVQLATDSLFFSTILDDSTLSATTRSVGPLGISTPYFWRVSAKNPGGASAYSSAWKFVTASPSDTSIHHYEYVFTPGHIFVYDIDNGHTLIKSISVPTTAGPRGETVSPSNGMLYISFGGDGGQYGNGSMLQYNLVHDSLGWVKNYSHGVDSHAMTPDGKMIYMPDGELSTDGKWYIVNASDGSETGVINTHGQSPHNTIVSLNGAHVYMGDRDIYDVGNDSFYVASTATNQVIKSAGPLLSGVRPFTINGNETFAFVTVTHLLGFQVCDLTQGTVPYTIDLTTMGFSNNCTSTPCQTVPSHGISLSPDEKELYVVDNRNSYIHVFDVSAIAQHIAPIKVADIKLQTLLVGSDSNCVYDCVKSGWVQHSRDGRYAYVGQSGDVINTATRTIVANLPALKNSREMLEIDWKNGVPIATTTRSGLGYVTNLSAPPAPTLLSPAKDTTLQLSTVTLIWNAAATAASYRVQLATDSLFGSVILDDSTVTATQRQVTSLAGNQKYYWRVSGANAGGRGVYSQRWSFTFLPAPVVPVLISPLKAAVCQPSTLTLTWSATAGAIAYRLQVAPDSLFSAPVVDDSTVTITSRQVSSLTGGRTYYWRVSTKTAGGRGSYSAVWFFTTFDTATLRDNFNRADGSLAGSNKWVVILNQPGSGAMNIVGNAIQPYSSAGNNNFGGVVWDSLMGTGSEASVRVLQKSGNFSYTSLFIYAKMNTKDYNTGTGYRLRYFEQSGSDLLEIHRVGTGYSVATTLATKNQEINPGDVLTFRVLCDNKTLVALVNGIQVLSVVDSVYMPSQWYFALRGSVFPTPVRFDDFNISAPPPVSSSTHRIIQPEEQPQGEPKTFLLEQNYPNPFNPNTNIRYQLPSDSRVSLRIYNLLGQIVSTLVNQREQAGYKSVNWNAFSFASGIYVYRLEAVSVADPSTTFTSVRKMLLMK